MVGCVLFWPVWVGRAEPCRSGPCADGAVVLVWEGLGCVGDGWVLGPGLVELRCWGGSARAVLARIVVSLLCGFGSCLCSLLLCVLMCVIVVV